MKPLTRLAGAFGICAVALVGYGIWYGTVAGESAYVADMNQQIAAGTTAQDRVATIRSNLVEVASGEASIQNYFVPYTGAVPFIDELEQRGRAQKATVSVLSVSTGKTNGHAAFLLTIAITGTFQAVLRTVGSIEYAPYDIALSNISITQSGKDAWNANVSLSVGTLSSVFAPAGTASSTATSTAPFTIIGTSTSSATP